MAQVRCADGRLLEVVPVPVLDRAGAPYEATLRLLLDGAGWGEVGERCDGVLRVLADRLADDVPQGTAERGVRSHCGDDVWEQLRPVLPRDAELLDLRARDPDDVTSAGELRVVLRPVRTWADDRWTLRLDAVLQAWGDDGTGVQAVLDLPGLRALVATLLAEADALAPCDGPAPG